MERLKSEGVTHFIELGSGKVLTGLIKRIGRGWPQPFALLNVEDMESLDRTRAALA